MYWVDIQSSQNFRSYIAIIFLNSVKILVFVKEIRRLLCEEGTKLILRRWNLWFKGLTCFRGENKLLPRKEGTDSVKME
jgi:hypothetical protein